MASSFLSVSLLLFISLHAADGFEYFYAARCEFNSSESKDIEFIDSYYYNKQMFIMFSSRLDRYVGYTELGVKNAARWNKDPTIMARMRALKESYCVPHVDAWYKATLPYSAPPRVTVRSVAPSAGSHPAMLVCSAYDFYPRTIRVTWKKNGEKVSQDVTSTDELQDGDWYYQVHSHLEYTPRSGDKLSCVVEHVSLKEPIISEWDPSMSESDRNKVAIGASGLILGLVLSLAGFIYYKRKARGRVLVPSS